MSNLTPENTAFKETAEAIIDHEKRIAEMASAMTKATTTKAKFQEALNLQAVNFHITANAMTDIAEAYKKAQAQSEPQNAEESA